MEDHSSSDPLMWYREAVMYGMDFWTVPGIREQRDAIIRRDLERRQQTKLDRLDARLIDAVIDTDDDEVPDDLLQDDPARPLDRWWWHLGKLRAGIYPAHLLPPHLREIYQPPEQRLAA